MAQLVARYLGVVEAASSSLVTQTKIRQSKGCRIFLFVSMIFERTGSKSKHAFKVFGQHNLALSTIVQINV